MRIFAPVILLIVFAASQYARHISYLECRLSNYFSNDSNKCDCEKIQNNTGDVSADTAPVPSHRHTHFDDSSFVLPLYSINNETIFSLPVHESSYVTAMSEGNPAGILRPPRIN